jgi:hypothetical protein
MASPKPTNTYSINPVVATWQDVTGSPVDYHFAYGQQTAVEKWDIADVDLDFFRQDTLGYAVSNGPGLGIDRQLPAQHPQMQEMRAVSVGPVEALAPTGQRAATGGQTAAFKLLRVTVNYERPLYTMLANGAADAEWKRFTIPDVGPTAEYIVREGGSYQWPADHPKLPNKPLIKGPARRQIVKKTRVTVTWYQVPDAGLFVGGWPGASPNIEGGIGCVNDDAFMDRAAGVWLFTGWKPEPRLMMKPNVGTGLAWDVKLFLLRFDLPDASYGNPANRGHNCVPWVDGKWYQVTSVINGQTIYPTYDFRKLFLMNS